MKFKDILSLLEREIKQTRCNINTIINSTVILLLSWILSFWIFQIVTVLGVYSLGVDVICYNSYIDFDTTNVAASQVDLWSDAENINTVFFTPVLFLIIIGALTFFFFVKWDIKSENLKRFGFWLILCCTLRLSGNYIFGHLLGLWNWNLVTDFMNLTIYPVVRYLFIILSIAITVLIYLAMAKKMKNIFDPYSDNRFSGLLSNILVPTIIACLGLLIWNIPYMPKNEILSIIYFFLLVVFCLVGKFIKMYGMLEPVTHNQHHEKIAKLPIILLTVACIINYSFVRGYHIEFSPYRYAFFEDLIMETILIAIIAAVFIVYKLKKKRESSERNIYLPMQDYDLAVDTDIKNNNSKDKQKTVPENNTENKTNQTLNSEVKHYNLDKYDQSNW